MPIDILMPALSPTMTEGNLAKWLKKEGDTVSAGDVIAEIETDKATMEVEAVDEGTIGKILIAEGTEAVLVNEPIAILLEEGEDASILKDYQPKKLAVMASASAVKEEAPAVVAASAPPVAHPPKEVTAPPVIAIPTVPSDGRIKASPLAKRIAAEKGLDLRMVKGTGPHGRIVKEDVEGANIQAPIGGGMASGAVQRSDEPYIRIPNNNVRKVIAKRLCESKQTVPHFYLSIECELDKLLAMRKDMNDEASGQDPLPYKLSVNDFVIKAVAQALRKIPSANASWTDEAILQYTNVDVSVAVAIDGGLITPVIRNADQKGIVAISHEMKDLAKRARENKLQPEEFQGGGFSISNLGMYNIKQFNAIINPPQSCILAIGAGSERPVIRDGELTSATIMDVSLSCDHRVVDGAVGAEFLHAFKGYIEKPVTMLL